MARVFNGSNQYIEVTSVPVSSWPVTVACWAYCNNYTANHSCIAIGNLSASPRLNYMGLGFGGLETGDPVIWQPSESGGASATRTTTGYTTGTWHHLAGVTSSETSHAVYIDGGSKGTTSGHIEFPTVNRTTIGSLAYSGGRVWYLNGGVLWVAIWNVALTDDEVASLAAGAHPTMIRPDALVFFTPLGGFDGDHDLDIVGGLSLTAVNSPTWSDDSPSGLVYPSVPIVGLGTASPPVSSIAPHVMYYKRMMTG